MTAEAQAAQKQVNPVLKIALEFGPLAVFFFMNSQYGIFYATGGFMVATVVALTLSKLLLGKVAMMPLVTGAFVMVFGGLTLYLSDDLFIKLKPTIVNCLFGAILSGATLMKYPLLKPLLGDAFPMNDEGWKKLTWRWALFFFFLAGLNEVVWRNFSTDFWVSFKVFGIMPLTFLFAGSQLYFLREHTNWDSLEADAKDES